MAGMHQFLIALLFASPDCRTRTSHRFKTDYLQLKYGEVLFIQGWEVFDQI